MAEEKIIDNLEAHVADLYHAEKNKGKGGEKTKRRVTQEEFADLSQAVPHGHRATLKRVMISLKDFHFLMVIGRGAFGKVFLARLKDED